MTKRTTERCTQAERPFTARTQTPKNSKLFPAYQLDDFEDSRDLSEIIDVEARSTGDGCINRISMVPSDDRVVEGFRRSGHHFSRLFRYTLVGNLARLTTQISRCDRE